MAMRTRLTADDLWKMGGDDVRHELVNGELVEMPRPGPLHGLIAARICRRLAEHADRHGDAVMVEAGFVLDVPGDPERVRGPDVSYVYRDRLPDGRVPEKFIRGAPDVAVEVLSPDDNPVEIQQKVRDYLDAGTRLVWVVAPRPKTATVYRADGSARLLREHEALEGEHVLPELSIPLADLFA